MERQAKEVGGLGIEGEDSGGGGHDKSAHPSIEEANGGGTWQR